MKSKNLMIQGTASDVGKSVITAGICRVLYQDGNKVAPFKSQNMSLNSYITKDGKEMGRAQVVQAEAACTEPRCAMNPILMKPTGDMNAQIIFNGEVYGDLSAIDYHTQKDEFKEKIKKIYKTLDDDYDMIILEGAGSPAEINLRERDLVNMGMAELVDSPVVLVGDIDKGGVFASIYGTLALLTEEERNRVKGVIINKFRGDITILEPGLKMLEDLINIPVLGVVPYFRLEIDEEDAVSDRLKVVRKAVEGEINIKIIRMPYMSNFTDFNVLYSLDGINASYAVNVEELNEADMVIIPGSKNTIKDLIYLKDMGYDKKLNDLNKKGTYIFGICGGFQMLGTKIINTTKSECDIEEIKGLGLLDIVTEFKDTKVTTQIRGEIVSKEGILSGCGEFYIEGYEIHMGRTVEVKENAVPFLELREIQGKDERRIEGYRSKDNRVFGTYVHGIFDTLSFTRKIAHNIRVEKGISYVEKELDEKTYKQIKDKEYNKLANILRDSLDMDKIYKILNGENVERNYK
ncbi:cobyric acid synthase [uncultured Clostridium sp.]|uniref:cobyric acid synthase n=1 Tax=uncultured Clostridium sp. TaxID=59620 RepID=UPI0026211801|nr:cobyric acid synthase [uncultured Clostridium sp.]